MGPMGKSMAKLYEELSKIKGLALKTNLSGFMGMKAATEATKVVEGPVPASVFALPTGYKTCLLYTSDAADERSSVDLGGRRIIKKKKKREQ